METGERVPSLLRGRYEPREHVGRGTRSTLLRAFDHQHNREVALKIRPARSAADRERLLAETRTLLALRPYAGLPVVREGFFQANDHVLIVDWVEGSSLAKVLADQGDPGLTPMLAVSYLAQLAQALDHLHAHGRPIVHGNVKPDNAVLTPEGQVVLVDFGLVDAGGGATASGYVAPEVAAGEPPTPAADVYGLAATAIALLTGSPPRGEVSWEGVDPVLAGALDRAVRRGLATDPARRPRRAGELVQRLRGALASALPTGVVTFCLTDIEGSAALWDAHAQAMGEVIARSEAIVAEAVESAGGRLIKARGEGDSTLSVFRRATDAAAAAVNLQGALARERWPEDIELRMRAALHTGEAELREGDYYGPILNRAARLRELARGGQILCSRATAELISDELPGGATLEEVGERRLRSLSRPEFVYALAHPDLPPSPAPSPVPAQTRVRPSGLEAAEAVTASTPGSGFVGRQQEWDQARSALQSSFRGQGQLLLVAGEAGIGKSRLVGELAALAAQTPAQVLWGRCYEGEALPAFWPWVEVVRALVERHRGPGLRDALGSGAAYVAQIVPEVKEIFPELEPPALLDAEAARFHLYDALTRLLVYLAGEVPMVVILEDLHWADAASLRLLGYLAPRLGDAAILLVGTYRPVEATPDHPLAQALASLARQTVTRRVALDGLDRGEVGSFIAATTGSPPSKALVAAVHKRTEGNPFFIIELLRLVETRGGRLSPEAVSASGVPAGVGEVVAQRVACLPEKASQLLTVAAVVGEEFSLGLVADSLDLNNQEALGLVEAALLAGLVGEVPDQPGSFCFSHALIREVLYEAPTALRRAYLHRRVGDALEHELEVAGGDIVLVELAHHFYRAAPVGGSDKAISYALRASDQATQRFAYDQAEEQLRRALELVESLPPGPERSRRELSVQLRLVYHVRGRAVPESGETATRAWELAQDLGDAEELLASCWRVANIHLLRG
ncbi:MAG TPA: AAA family ATPase, partial [Acidimicrobiales bacterium]|nr:AAA family ATPase [Acidimicrobiales bacterium]